MEFVLNALVMGFRPLWNAQRQLAAVHLFLHDAPDTPTDTAHLLRILQETWAPSSPMLLLSPQSPVLLAALLQHIQPQRYWALEVRGTWLRASAALAEAVAHAAARGVRLVWRGPLAERPDGEVAQLFTRQLLSLQPGEAAHLVNASSAALIAQHQQALAGQLLEDVHSQALAHRALDVYGMEALAGWPTDDVLHRLRGTRVLTPSHAHVQRLLQAIGSDQSLDTLEGILSEDPLLAYRFMLYANSAALGARNPIHALRRALVMLGYGTLQTWLLSQLEQASHEHDLQPIRHAGVLRAQLTAQLLDAGVSQELRSEVYLCGLFARLHELLDEPAEATLLRLPLSERIPDAILHGQGPYAPSLQLAMALEREDGAALVRSLCEAHELPLEHVNRSLLRLACDWPNQRPSW